MAIVTIGDVTWNQVAYPIWVVDGFGVDTVTVKYQGYAPLKEQFENGLVKWSPMPALTGAANIPAYPSMSLETWGDAEGTPNIYTCDVRYKGFRSGVIPVPKSVPGISAQSAQGQGTDTTTIDPVTGQNAVVTGTFYYLASRTTWTWYETSSPPSTPRYATVINSVNPFSTIYRYSLQTTDPATGQLGGPLNNISIGAFIAVFNSLAPTAVVSDYTQELIIPGKLWYCQSIIDYKLLGAS